MPCVELSCGIVFACFGNSITGVLQVCLTGGIQVRISKTHLTDQRRSFAKLVS
jgi:hypothetical protein